MSEQRCIICDCVPAFPVMPPPGYEFLGKYIWICREHNGGDEDVVATHAFTSFPVVFPARGERAAAKSPKQLRGAWKMLK